jgi:arylsulfatase A-like enzyme
MSQQHCDGVSLMPLLRGGHSLEREAIYWHYPHYGNQGGTPGSSIRSGDYKLIEFFEDNHVELYDLREDISEEHDLAGQRPKVTSRLRSMLHQWQVSVQAKIPQSNPDYVPWR